jgi:hypothetical protein
MSAAAIGSVLLQPRKVAAPAAISNAALLEDFLALAIRLVFDRTHNGPCFGLIETALDKVLQNLLTGIKKNEAATVAKFEIWVKPLVDKLGAIGQRLPGQTAAQEAIASGDAMVGLLVELLDGITTDELAKHLDTGLKLLHDDLGLTSAVLDQQITAIFDEIVKQLRGAPRETDVAMRENRFEIIVLVQRIRREIQGKFTLPEINVDRLAQPLLDRLKSFNYDDGVKRAANVGAAIKSGLDIMGVISDEVTFSMGFSGGMGAAAPAGPASKHCWYASWVTGSETNDTDPVHSPALTPYSFKNVSADTMELATLHLTWPFILIDGILVAIIGYIKGRGVYSITTLSWVRDLIYTLSIPLGDVYVPGILNIPLTSAFGGGSVADAIGNLTLWLDQIYNVIVSLLCSLEGRSLDKYDGFLYLLRFIFRFGGSSLPVDRIRDAILSIITLYNHDPAASPSPLNKNNDGLIQFLMRIAGPLFHAGILPDNYFSINGEYGSLIAAVLLGGLAMSLGMFFLGLLISRSIAHDWPDAGPTVKHFFKGWLLGIPSFVGFWFLFQDGSTDGGKRGYTPDGGRGTKVAFAGYPPSASSPYLMPFVGSAECIQGNHGFWSHNSVTSQIFSYDFSLNLGQDVLCMRDGVIVEVKDSVTDDDHSEDGNHLIVKHTTANADHDKDVTSAANPNGTPTTTYAKYYHGQKDTIKAAFGGTLPAVGTAVTQGQLLFSCNSTGMSRCNHIHVQVNGDDGAGNPSNYTIPWVFKDISGNGIAKSQHVYDSQNVKKP